MADRSKRGEIEQEEAKVTKEIRIGCRHHPSISAGSRGLFWALGEK
jgi:hypothetical protein